MIITNTWVNETWWIMIDHDKCLVYIAFIMVYDNDDDYTMYFTILPYKYVELFPLFIHLPMEWNNAYFVEIFMIWAHFSTILFKHLLLIVLPYQKKKHVSFCVQVMSQSLHMKLWSKYFIVSLKRSTLIVLVIEVM